MVPARKILSLSVCVHLQQEIHVLLFGFLWRIIWARILIVRRIFFDNGMKVVDYPADFWIFHKPQIIAVKAGPGEIISKEGLSEDVNPESDLLIFKSGWSKRRDEGEYCLRNPGIEPALGVWLRKSFPNIRALGIDWVSVSSYVHRDIGRKAHFEFLNPAGAGHPILLIEDMDIPEDLQSLNQIWALPLRVEELDSSPCTIIGVS